MSDIKVLIVDDSAVVRKVLVEVLRAQKGIEVIGTAADPLFAMERMKVNWPDVIVLDVEMPRMDGVTFLRKLMQERPTPVVICSTLTEAGAPTTLEALAAGAVTFITKPKLGLQDFLAGAAAEITAAIRSAASANVRRRAAPRPAGVHAPVAPPKHTADVILAPGNGRAMSRDELQQRVWNVPYRHRDRSVDVCVRRLREKVDRRSTHTYVQTHYGVGYRFAPLAKTAAG